MSVPPATLLDNM